MSTRQPAFYDDVNGLIEALVRIFKLYREHSLIMRTYQDICRNSLAFPRDIRPRGNSRINHDGIPIQFGVTIGPDSRALQFISEAARPDVIGRERMEANRLCIATVAEHFHAGILPSVNRLLDTLVPVTDIDLLTDPGGAYWIGVAFATGSKPRLKIYLNDCWGKEEMRWQRLSRFAAYFESAQWYDIANRLVSYFQPMGAAITLSSDRPPAGRIYLSTYGKRLDFYEELADIYGGPNLRRQVHAFGWSILGDDYVYPTQSAVCSFGIGRNSITDFKFELCAHCLFSNDREAAARLRYWFETAGLDAGIYTATLEILSSGHLSDKSLDHHCYMGTGLQHGSPYTTVYLKPRLNL